MASKVLKVNPEKIFTSETTTDKVPNTLATAASLGSDLNGMAVLVYSFPAILKIKLTKIKTY